MIVLTMKKSCAWRAALPVALAINWFGSAATSQELPQPAATAGAREIMMQTQTGAPLAARSVSRSAQAVAAQAVGRDPAVAGKLERRWLSAPPAGLPTAAARVEDRAEKEDSGAYAQLDETNFAPVLEEELAPGGKRDISLDVAASSVLLGSVQWIGSNDPLQLTLSLNGAKLAAGTPARGHDQRGRVTVTALAGAAGQATLSVANPTNNTARVQLVLGALPQ